VTILGWSWGTFTRQSLQGPLLGYSQGYAWTQPTDTSLQSLLCPTPNHAPHCTSPTISSQWRTKLIMKGRCKHTSPNTLSVNSLWSCQPRGVYWSPYSGSFHCFWLCFNSFLAWKYFKPVSFVWQRVGLCLALGQVHPVERVSIAFKREGISQLHQMTRNRVKTCLNTFKPFLLPVPIDFESVHMKKFYRKNFSHLGGVWGSLPRLGPPPSRRAPVNQCYPILVVWAVSLH